MGGRLPECAVDPSVSRTVAEPVVLTTAEQFFATVVPSDLLAKCNL